MLLLLLYWKRHRAEAKEKLRGVLQLRGKTKLGRFKGFSFNALFVLLQLMRKYPTLHLGD